jgi:hypothetical protein
MRACWWSMSKKLKLFFKVPFLAGRPRPEESRARRCRSKRRACCAGSCRGTPGPCWGRGSKPWKGFLTLVTACLPPRRLELWVVRSNPAG